MHDFASKQVYRQFGSLMRFVRATCRRLVKVTNRLRPEPVPHAHQRFIQSWWAEDLLPGFSRSSFMWIVLAAALVLLYYNIDWDRAFGVKPPVQTQSTKTGAKVLRFFILVRNELLVVCVPRRLGQK